MPTGSGKSAIYQIAGTLIDGPSIVVSPLLALQDDQSGAIGTDLGGAIKINSAGEAHVVDVAERVIRAIADRPARLTFVRRVAPTPVAGSPQGSDVYLGSIPDMSGGAGHGLRLTGVHAGSPAEQAGLASGDVIVEFGGRTVKDLYDFSDALYAHRPGDTVSVIVLRNGDRRQLTVHLGKRG